jgi:hypothetical protein
MPKSNEGNSSWETVIYEAERSCGSISGNSEKSITGESDRRWSPGFVKIRQPRCVGCVDVISCPGVERPGRSRRQKYYLYLHGKRGVAFFGSTAPMHKKY